MNDSTHQASGLLALSGYSLKSLHYLEYSHFKVTWWQK